MGMPCQFVHTQTHSNKGNKSNRGVRDILSEAAREEGHVAHLLEQGFTPQPPELLAGLTPPQILEKHDRQWAAVRETIRDMNKGLPRRHPDRIENISDKTHTLTSWIISYPIPVEKLTAEDLPEFERWKREALAALKDDAERRGLSFEGAVLHMDEKMPHIHAYALADNLKMDSKQCHDGWRAKLPLLPTAAERKSMSKDEVSRALKVANKGYHAAMRDFQDWWHVRFGCHFDHARYGPRRRRNPTRAAHNAESAKEIQDSKRIAAALAADQKIDQVAAEAEAEARAILSAAEAQAADLVKDAAHQAAMITGKAQEQAQGMLQQARQRADQLIAAARDQLAQVQRLANPFRNLIGSVSAVLGAFKSHSQDVEPGPVYDALKDMDDEAFDAGLYDQLEDMADRVNQPSQG